MKKSRYYKRDDVGLERALQHIEEVQRAIREGEFSKNDAETYLDLRGWL